MAFNTIRLSQKNIVPLNLKLRPNGTPASAILLTSAVIFAVGQTLIYA